MKTTAKNNPEYEPTLDGLRKWLGQRPSEWSAIGWKNAPDWLECVSCLENEKDRLVRIILEQSMKESRWLDGINSVPGFEVDPPFCHASRLLDVCLILDADRVRFDVCAEDDETEQFPHDMIQLCGAIWFSLDQVTEALWEIARDESFADDCERSKFFLRVLKAEEEYEWINADCENLEDDDDTDPA